MSIMVPHAPAGNPELHLEPPGTIQLPRTFRTAKTIAAMQGIMLRKLYAEWAACEGGTGLGWRNTSRE